MTNLESILKSREVFEREQDGRGVGGHGVYLSPWIHQEYTSDTEVHAERGQEYLTRGKEYIDPRKTQSDDGTRGKKQEC